MDVDWAHLPAVAVQVISTHCCPASKARLRGVCSAWHDALATRFTTLFIGPGSPAPLLAHADGSPAGQQQQQQQALRAAFPAVTALHLTASSSREYAPSYTQGLAQLLSASQRQVTALQLQELHELDGFDTLDAASLWDVLAAAAPALRGRLAALSVSGCFWNQPESFGVLRQLTALTELRLANTPLETAHELCCVAGMSQLVHLELGIIFDGSSSQHDVPRALEAFSGLQRLQVLSVPMWRRSLGGRAHPLAPALSAALQRLTGLTSLAVDGKFSQLRVVASLAGLRQLASAAPMSLEGWQAICHLQQLTLLTSLTPAHELLQLNPARPHPGCDLAALSCKASLRGADVAVLHPEHLAALGQFTALQQLNLRCAATFHAAKQQGQLLTALACLPGCLTQLTLGPLLPLCAQLFASVAGSAPGLRELHARFTHVAEDATQEQYYASSPAAAAAAAAAGAAGAALPSQGADDDDTLMLGPEGEEVPGSVSHALSRLRQLHTLELTLAGDEASNADATALSPMRRRSSSYGGALLSPRAQAAAAATHDAAWPSAAAAGAALPGDGGPPPPGMASSSSSACGWVQLQLDLLPCSLQRLQLSGPWQLLLDQAAAGAVAAGASSLSGGTTTAAGQQQQQQVQASQCTRCHKRVPAGAGATVAADDPPPATTAASEGDAAAALCRCMQGLNIMQLPGGTMASGSGRQGSPVLLASGLKRPASYGAAQPPQRAAAATGGSGAAVASGSGAPSILSQQQHQRQQAGVGDVFMVERPPELASKRSRSFSNMLARQAAASTSSAPAAAPSEGAGVPSPSTSARQLLQQPVMLPCLSQLGLFQCRLTYGALTALVAAADQQLSKLELVQLAVTSPAAEGGSSSSSSCLTAEQLLQLPVSWPCLQEWHIQPYQLWSMLQLGCLDSAAADDPTTGAPQLLPRFSRLLSLRRLCVSNVAAAAVADGAEQQHQQHPQRLVTPLVALPLHDAAALQRLLLALQSGLQHLPVLRHLVLHDGPVTKQQPQLADVSDGVWGPAGEQLLDALPAVRVHHCSPVVVAAGQPMITVLAPPAVHDEAAPLPSLHASFRPDWPEPEYMI